ncbi:MAG TPA: hypothetical protein VL049_29705 [Candidatus Dormibacteraeota bacterium]|nr:hypothetical protein [Candidatus Dormibacteraeota bacterium]
MAARSKTIPAPRVAVPAPVVDRGPSTWLLTTGLFLLLFAVYTLNFRLRGAGDSIPTRRLPFSLLREGNLDLDEFTWERTERGALPYFVHYHDGHIYSVTTVATAVVVTPLYLLPAWWLAHANVSYDDVRARVLEVVMERIAAAMLTALSAVVLFVMLRRLTTWRWALALTLLYGFGTSAWSISSQALWAHAVAQLTLALLCLILIAPSPSRLALIAAGAVAAVSVANRPQTAVLAGLVFLFLAVHQRWRALYYAALPGLAAIAIVIYNYAIFSNALGGYGGFEHFNGSLPEGVAGLLVSPNRGLLVFTPIMVFALWGAVRVWRVSAPPWLRWLSVALLLHILVYARFKEWWAGYTYGPRYFSDVLPALTIFLVYGLVPYCRWQAMRVLAAVLALYGVAVQAIGAYAADDGWNREPTPLERAPWRVWDWGDLQIVRSARNGLHPGELSRVIVDTIRDSSAVRVAPLEGAQLAGPIAPLHLPRQLAVGGAGDATVRITNDGGVAWPAFNGEGVISARYLTFLLVRWYTGDALVPGVGDVIPLPENLAPGESLQMDFRLEAPARAGDYDVELRVTQALDGRRGVVGPDALRAPVRVGGAAVR